MQDEVWRVCPSTEGKYEVSNFGRVRNTQTLRVLKGIEKHKGGRKIIGGNGEERVYQSQDYLQISVWRGGRVRPMLIHKLMAEVWLPPRPSELHLLNHRDGNKHNNSCENLEWTTSTGNNVHAFETGLRRRGFKTGKNNLLSAEQISHIRNTADWQQPGLVRQLAQAYGVSATTIYMHRNRGPLIG